VWRLTVDLGLDREWRIDALDGFDRNRRLVDPRQIEGLAPRSRVSLVAARAASAAPRRSVLAIR
jgi:hypothetical protein